MERQQVSCASLWPGLCLVAGAIIGGIKWGWIGLLVGAPVGLLAGILSILVLGLAVLAADRLASKRGGPPVD